MQKLLIVAGALDGASGFILSVNMSKAMNRSFTNVLFGAFGQVQTVAAGTQEARPVKSATAEWTIGDCSPGPISMQLREQLTGIQTGRLPDTHGWMQPLA